MEFNDKTFDQILQKGLKKYNEPINNHFAQELLARIEKIEQQKALRRVLIQEKASLAAFILLPIIIIAMMIVFASVIANAGNLITGLVPSIFVLLKLMIKQWQMIVYYSTAALICLYVLYQTLAAEN
ncbi:MAG: hypothetical protein BWY69_00532 [Planctomycetes bacterium ADurb.Bin401]|nr:MAG: hypothetical protein BWY69_00532 [Planctomycetes bacterium ADurb.Bin401]